MTSKKVKVRGKKRKFTLGKARFSINPGQTKRVRVRLKPPLRKLLRSNRAARSILATAKVSDTEGNRATVTRTLKVKGSGN